MVKPWIVGGVGALLISVGVVTCGQIAAAEQSQKSTKVVISDVMIQGNRRMTTEQIKHHLHTQPGKEYNPAVVDEDVRELYKTHQFSTIQTFLQPDGAGKAKICFTMREMPNMVQKVTFLGAKHAKEEELRNITGVKPGKALIPNLNRLGCRQILELYEDMGRLNTQCTLVKGGDADDTEVVYQITEGPKVQVRDIQFTGNTFVSNARLTEIIAGTSWFHPHRIGTTYHKERTEYESNEIRTFYRDSGYQDVKVAVERQRSVDGRQVTLIFHIQEGERSRKKDD